jgi:hypothetical protein
MENILLRRSLVCGIAILFLGLCVTSSIGVNVEQKSKQSRVGELAWWKFDETSGNTAHDSSGHGYDGTVYGATWGGGVLSFDGVDDYVDFDSHATDLGMNKTDDYIVQARFKSTGSGMLYSMSHTNPDRAYFDLMIDGDGKVGVITGDVTCTFDLFTTDSYNDGEWHIIESNFQGDATNPTLDLIIDGELDATTTEWLCPMIDEDFITAKVGRNSNAESEYFYGEIDDIKIYKNLGDIEHNPNITIITGPTEGKVGETLTFTFSAEDIDGDEVRFIIDWGDEDKESTIYVPEGTNHVETHVYDTEGQYTIEAYAQDETGRIGPTGYHSITIPRGKSTNNIMILRFLERFPLLQELIQQLESGL